MQVAQLLELIFTAGVVFDGLSTSRAATDRYLRNGDTSGVRGRDDLALLQDLEDAASFVLETVDDPLNSDYLKRLNAQLTRSAALNPGSLRTDDQGIGVNTRFGRHDPPAISEGELNSLVVSACAVANDRDAAIALFLDLARAQPFEDGNKRTAIFAANKYLLRTGSDELLTAPYSDENPQMAAKFSDLLARFYVFDERDPVQTMLLECGFKTVRPAE